MKKFIEFVKQHQFLSIMITAVLTIFFVLCIATVHRSNNSFLHLIMPFLIILLFMGCIAGAVIFFKRASTDLRMMVGFALTGLCLIIWAVTGLFGESRYDPLATYSETTQRAGSGIISSRVVSGAALNREEKIGRGIALLVGIGCIGVSCIAHYGREK